MDVARLRRLRPALAVAALLGLLAAVPAAPAAASPKPAVGSAALTLPAGGVSEVPAGALDELIGEAPLGEAGIPLAALEVPFLKKLLAARPGILELAEVKGLGKTAGVEAAIAKAVETLAGEGETFGELLSETGLAIYLEEALEETYEKSAAGKKLGAPEFEEAVELSIEKTPEEAIDEGLASLSLGELLSLMLREAGEPGVFAGQLFAALDSEGLEELLGTTLSGAAFTDSDAAEVAAAIGITPAELAEAVGQTPEQLPESAIGLTVPLSNGQALGVFDAAKGLAFGLIGEAPPPEEPEEPEEEPEEETGAGSGEPGGGPGPPPAGSGSAEGPPSDTTPTAATASTAPPAPITTTAGVGRLRILSHRVKGGVVTLLLQIPASGRLTLHASNLRPVSRTLSRAGRVSIRLSPTRAALASLQKHRRLTVKLKAVFAPLAGAASSATVTLGLA